MKKLICLFLALCTLLSLAACGGEAPETTTAPATTTSSVTTTAPTETTGAPEPTLSQAAKDALDGKKILFIGNSYTYYGNCVIHKGSQANQAERSNDPGLFYQLCKENGIDVSVTNWTYGGHNINETMGEVCTYSECGAPISHFQNLVDPVFDYVCIQPYFERDYQGDLVAHLQPTMDFFREANPDVKFLFLVPHMTFVRKFVWRDDITMLQDTDITIVNWGAMLDDILNKRIEVPGATQQYFFGTFVISKDANDGHHQNLLVGYLTALMTYCAITGESAVGQPYDFVDDPSIHPNFDMEAFKAKYYVHEPFTNFVEVYRSEADMLGLQQLTDQYIAKFNGEN